MHLVENGYLGLGWGVGEGTGVRRRGDAQGRNYKVNGHMVGEIRTHGVDDEGPGDCLGRVDLGRS